MEKSNLNIEKYRKKREKKKKLTEERISTVKKLLTGIKLVIAVDNGATGTISALSLDGELVFFSKTPVKMQLDYTQANVKISRIDHQLFKEMLENIIKNYNINEIVVILERPMVNQTRFHASKGALRSFESTIVTLETLKLQYTVIDSKKWQHYFFGKHTTLLNLKFESMKKGIEFFNRYKDQIVSHGDADSLLMCKFTIEKMVTN